MPKNKIENMTPEQERQMIPHREKWRGIGLATGEADIEVVAPVINDFYDALGKSKPYIWRVKSPMMAQLVLNLVANLWANLGDNLRDNLGANLGDNPSYHRTYLWGSLDSYWVGYYLFPQECLKADIFSKSDTALLNQWATLSRNMFWWWPYETVCFVSDRPTHIHMNNRYQLHCDNDMAVKFSDGWGIYVINGVNVTEQIVVSPETITTQQILDEQNEEVKRVMIERYGEDKFIHDTGLVPVHEDAFGKLYRIENGNEDMVIVHVTDSSTGRKYWLPVPSSYNPKTFHPENEWDGGIRMVHAKQAVAWSFGYLEDDYNPLIET